MSLSAVRNSTVRFVLALVLLVLGAASEEFLPKFLGVGVPILLSLVALLAVHEPIILPILFALSAGFMEDALSSVPLLASPSFFLLLVLSVRTIRLPLVTAGLAFPLYQVWICLWTIDHEGSIFTRLVLSIPIGFITMMILARVVESIERKVAADEAD